MNYQSQALKRHAPSKQCFQIGGFLYKNDYYWPVGADILEDSVGTQWIIDLNVRKLKLGLLRGYFFGDRKMCCVAFITEIKLEITKLQFHNDRRKEFEEGTMITCARYECQNMNLSPASLILGEERANSRYFDSKGRSDGGLGASVAKIESTFTSRPLNDCDGIHVKMIELYSQHML